jgi:predicted DNA-binding transcriptional regulator AlpA
VTDDLKLIAIGDFCKRNSISRATLYRLIERGSGPATVRVGGRRLVTIESETEWRRGLEAEALDSAPGKAA